MSNPLPIDAMPPTHRIAFVSGLAFGGSTTFLCNLTGELTMRHVPVVVVSPENENPFASDFERKGVKVFLHDNRGMIFEDRMAAMLRTLAEFQPTIVVSCLGATSYEVLRYVPSNVHRMGIVQSDHTIFYDAIRPFAGFMDAAVGVSTPIAAQFAAMDEFHNVPKLCLLHGVAMPSTVVPRGLDGHPLRILYFGRITHPQKRVRLFLDILEVLKKSGIPFKWTIAGEGEERNFLEANMKTDVPGQDVSFTGPIRYADVPALLDRHDICLLASDCEGFGLSVLEAMGHGLVPVVSDLPAGIPEMVDKTTGILVSVDDVEGYARAIIHLHEHRNELAAKSTAAHERVKTKFSLAAMADRWLAVLPKTIPTVEWPDKFKIQPPLKVPHPIYFSPPMRVLRRLAMKFRR